MYMEYRFTLKKSLETQESSPDEQKIKRSKSNKAKEFLLQSKVSEALRRRLEICSLPSNHTAENIANALFNVLSDCGLINKILCSNAIEFDFFNASNWLNNFEES
ncbi:hypothetical protein BpHYR1_013089 [Brachionus plicatilis]|uniref:Uncharacterized protein n=1 Tax=Brachionus plicatilis TaxID=10195 RepID=A0A3M7SFD4_BRAPC|nr:hypothetical protein BpHYR1_013089 [Brachionus plicatilis]